MKYQRSEVRWCFRPFIGRRYGWLIGAIIVTGLSPVVITLYTLAGATSGFLEGITSVLQGISDVCDL